MYSDDMSKTVISNLFWEGTMRQINEALYRRIHVVLNCADADLEGILQRDGLDDADSVLQYSYQEAARYTRKEIANLKAELDNQ
jgi:hypothetical protein